MNWDDLNIFLTVARRPKLELAALQLNMDSTTISRRIKRLEKELGSTLFERTRRGHALTPSGEKLIAHVEKIETLALDIAADSASQNLASGRVRLGAPEGVGSYVIAPALEIFQKDYPDIKVDLIAQSGFVSVPKREADMSLLLARPSSGRLKIRKLSEYSLGLYCAAKLLEKQGPIKSFEQLGKRNLIGYVDELIYSNQLRYFDEYLPGRTPDLCSTSINAQLQMTKAGAGLCILPIFMANKHGDLTRVLPKSINVKRNFWLAVHEDVASLTRNRLMSDFLANAFSTIS